MRDVKSGLGRLLATRLAAAWPPGGGTWQRTQPMPPGRSSVTQQQCSMVQWGSSEGSATRLPKGPVIRPVQSGIRKGLGYRHA